MWGVNSLWKVLLLASLFHVSYYYLKIGAKAYSET